MKTGILFGTFDGIHAGHRSAIRQALNRCEHLIIAVTPDNIVEQLKEHLPKFPASERCKKLEEEFPRAVIVLGDSIFESGIILKRFKPNVVFLGYDQQNMIPWIEESKLPYKILDSLEPHIYHSSILNNENNITISAESIKSIRKKQERK